MKRVLLGLYLMFTVLPVGAEELVLVDQAVSQLRWVDLSTAKTTKTVDIKVEDPVALVETAILDGQGQRLVRDTQQALLPANPVAIAFDDQYFWILHSRTLKLSQLNRSDLTPVGPAKALGESSPFLIHPDLALAGALLWVTNPRNGTLLAVDRATRSVTKTINLGEPGYLMPVAAAGGQVYVSLGDTLFVLDSSGATLKKIPLREANFSERPIVITQLLADNTRVYAVESNTQQIFIFDRQTLAPLPALKFDQTPGTVALNQGHLVIPSPQTGQVQILSPGVNKLPRVSPVLGHWLP